MFWRKPLRQIYDTDLAIYTTHFCFSKHQLLLGSALHRFGGALSFGSSTPHSGLAADGEHLASHVSGFKLVIKNIELRHSENVSVNFVCPKITSEGHGIFRFWLPMQQKNNIKIPPAEIILEVTFLIMYSGSSLC